MSGSRRPALSVRRDQQCNRPPEPTSPLEVNVTMPSGVHPIRAKKVRYYEDARLQERILPPPVLARPKEARPDDWSARPLPPRPDIAEPPPEGDQGDDDGPRAADRRRQPELEGMKPVEKREPLDNEFLPGAADELEAEAPRVGRMNELMQGVVRQASLDPGDDLGL
jgi:type IV secretion system protein VirD4